MPQNSPFPAGTVTLLPKPLALGGKAPAAVSRTVPVEVPVEIVYAPKPHAVMMASPSDMEDFAAGFSLTEGVIETMADIRQIEAENFDQHIRLTVTLSAPALQRHLARDRAIGRSMPGRTGCGICGVEDIAHLPKAQNTPTPRMKPGSMAIQRALAELETLQPLNKATHAVHAAAWCDPEGPVLAVREDVGRHNALDKLIGALLRQDVQERDGFLLITSRCSFEMVEKAAIFGAGTLVAISAPTSLAIERAQAHGMNLIAIARPDYALDFTISSTTQARLSA